MEPASSSDDDSSVENFSSKYPVPAGSGSESSESSDDEEINDFDQLPSEDSCLDDDSDEYASDDHGKDAEDLTIEERLALKRTKGKTSRAKGIRGPGTKTINAIAVAQERLAAMKKNKKKRSHSSDSDNELDSDTDRDALLNDKRKKKSKNIPTVASSTRRDFYSRGAPDLNSSGIGVEIGAHKYKSRDPRMQSLSGHFDQNIFEKRYEFLEKIQDEEIERLKERTKAWKTSGRKGRKLRKKLGLSADQSAAAEDEAELARLRQEKASRQDDKIRRMAKSTVKKKIRDDVAAGKRGAFYLKKRDMKKLEIEAKFEHIQKQGGDSAVQKVLAKRRKRKMGKDSFMPNAST